MTSNSRGQVKPLIPFCSSDKILFVGEGNFSFAASCVENHLEHGENVVATSLDDESTLLEKYTDAGTFVETIRDCCGTVLHSIDATRLHEKFAVAEFDVCIFMFPHVAAGIADEARNVLTNQKMLTAFFKSVQQVIQPHGVVAVTLAVSKTYDLWDLKNLGKSQGLVVKTSGVFNGKDYPGYEHRRTQGREKSDTGFSSGKGEERTARWTIFTKMDAKDKLSTLPSRSTERGDDLSDDSVD
ncbi:protein of unknown function [Taphrina deformans PYCC 5710]|uniref:25S rRNA (uridine-N(3))-methyltransferase BMT5-like domain-containing protein n=1 Tax=Taphrina deformans (strain PYCC 5710 / ATCC 11124 / CBS 356.35 / IMI 108563 / JCM 9778 / NBRC 8474) TaxID=1097556 RepID=R4XIQ7_TAPDE|nr:protein of unknown function [Taphrina deformans PYCC 5710]|eukprot:CCG84384.1 protein of unknown function [Taphrina deformans PYCC 5710]